MRYRASAIALVLMSAVVWAQKERAACRSSQFVVNLVAGQAFGRDLGDGLTLRMQPTRLGPKGDRDGWEVSVVDADSAHSDYIYPVNPPLRFNGLQILGPSYGDDAQTSLNHSHEMWFLLKKADYDRISLAVDHALWPYSAPHPDSTVEEYSAALNGAALGRLKLKPLSFDIDSELDSIRRLKVRVEVIAPVSFAFSPELKPRSVSCPPAPE